MALSKGDRVLVLKKDARNDSLKTYTKFVGVIKEVFNACDSEGDHWQYRVQGDKGQYLVFYEGTDEGKITLLD